MKRYMDNDYGLTINRAKLEDRGEYIVRAKNQYGTKEEVVFLNVHSECDFLVSSTIVFCTEVPEVEPAPRLESPSKRVFREAGMDMPIVNRAPNFTFHLRPRLIQQNHHCKLICCVQGNPTPKVREGGFQTLASQQTSTCAHEIHFQTVIEIKIEN